VKTRTLLLLAGVAAVGFYLWKKKRDQAGAVIRNADGTIARVLPPQSSSGIVYDLNQYGGTFVGPPYDPTFDPYANN